MMERRERRREMSKKRIWKEMERKRRKREGGGEVFCFVVAWGWGLGSGLDTIGEDREREGFVWSVLNALID